MVEKETNAYSKFYTTTEVMKILKIVNRACLDLFHEKYNNCKSFDRFYIFKSCNRPQIFLHKMR